MTNKIIERFIPVLITGVEGCIRERLLMPQKTEKEAQNLIDQELIKCKPGCMGEIRRVFVCVVEENQLILPKNTGKLKIVQ